MANAAPGKALTSFKTKAGQTVEFAMPGIDARGDSYWNPDVAPGQRLTDPALKIYTPADYPLTDQLVALKDDGKMVNIAAWIEEHYGSGAGKDIHALSPLQAMELCRKILAERTEYDNSPPKEQIEKDTSMVFDILARDRQMPFSDFFKLMLDNRPANDARDVLDLLEKPDDKDVVCRNQSETIAVLFEAVKKLQAKNTSRLNTTAVRVFHNELLADPLFGRRIGTLDEGKTAVSETDKGQIVAMRVDREPEPQEKHGVHDRGEGKIWLVSPEEQKKVIPQNDERLFVTDGPIGHMLVQFITRDKQGVYHVKVIDSTNETSADSTSRVKADHTGAIFMQEALLQWQGDTSWQELRNAHTELWKHTTHYSPKWFEHRQHIPLLLLQEVKDTKRALTEEEKLWCEQNLAMSRAWFATSATPPGDAEMALNMAKLYTHTGDHELADKALELCNVMALGRPGAEPVNTHYEARVDLAQKVLDAAKERKTPKMPPSSRNQSSNWQSRANPA